MCRTCGRLGFDRAGALCLGGGCGGLGGIVCGGVAGRGGGQGVGAPVDGGRVAGAAARLQRGRRRESRGRRGVQHAVLQRLFLLLRPPLPLLL